jgi:hypothetical protein
MKSRLIVLGLLLLVIVQNGFLVYFGRQFSSLKGEVYVLQQQVAQLRVWRASVGKPKDRADNDLNEGGRGGKAVLRRQYGPLARYLATLIVLEHSKALALDKKQLERIQGQIDVYKKKNAEIEPLQKQIAALWEHPEEVLYNAQQRYVVEHPDIIDAKTDELLLIMKREESSLFDMLVGFVQESRANM